MSIRYLFIASAGLMLSACDAPVPTSDDPEPPAAVSETLPALSASAYMMQNIADLGLTGEETPAEIGALLERKFGVDLGSEGFQSQTLRLAESRDKITIIFEVEGFTDDSVQGEQHVIEMPRSATVDRSAMRYGTRIKCWRGFTPDVWINNACS